MQRVFAERSLSDGTAWDACKEAKATDSVQWQLLHVETPQGKDGIIGELRLVHAQFGP